MARGPRPPRIPDYTTQSFQSVLSAWQKTSPPMQSGIRSKIKNTENSLVSFFLLQTVNTDCTHVGVNCLKYTTQGCTGRTRIKLQLCVCTERSSRTTGPSHTQGHECLCVSKGRAPDFPILYSNCQKPRHIFRKVPVGDCLATPSSLISRVLEKCNMPLFQMRPYGIRSVDKDQYSHICFCSCFHCKSFASILQEN